MKRCFAIFVIVMSLFMVVLPASATTLLINQQNPEMQYGYGLSDWDNMTSALNTSFGAGNITVNGGQLTDLGYMLGFDRLWITAAAAGSSLTGQEISNITSYIATGRRVVLIGENDSWYLWNNDILATVGGLYNLDDTSATLTPVISNDLTAGITALETIADGIAVGGTSLFNLNVATLWGSNVVSLLSVNVIDDTYGTSAGNMRFETNMANWLAGSGGSVPEPATMLLLGLGLVGLAGIRRKF